MKSPSPRRERTSEPADNFLASVHVLSNRITRAFFSQTESKHDVTLPEWRVLLSLMQNPGLTANEIKDRWAMDKMTISRAVVRLVDMGRVVRSRNPKDGRSYVLSVTKKGARLYKKVLPAANARYRELLSCLTETERSALRRLLSKMIRHIEKLL